MTIVKVNNNEGGTNLVQPTGTDTGSGDAYSGVLIQSTATVQYDTSTSAHGSKSVKCNANGASQAACVYWSGLASNSTLSSGKLIAVRVYIKRTANPATTQILLRGLNGTTTQWSVTLNTSGFINVTGADGSTLASGAVAIDIAGGWNRVEATFNITSGAWTCNLYKGAHLETGTSDSSLSGTSSNLGTATDIIRCGNASSNNTAVTNIDDFAVGSTAIGAYVSGESSSGGGGGTGGTILKVNNNEGGSNGVTPTSADTGSGDAYSSITATTGIVHYTTAQAAHGTLGLEFNSNGGANLAYATWSALGSLTGTLYVRCYFRRTSLVAVNTKLIQFRDNSGTAAGGLQINTTTGFLQFFDKAGTATGSAGTVAHDIAAWNRIECSLNPTTFAWTAALYKGANLETGTVSDSISGTGTGVTFGANLDRVDFGNCATNNPGQAFLDDCALSSTGAIGPWLSGESSGGTVVIPETTTTAFTLLFGLGNAVALPASYAPATT